MIEKVGSSAQEFDGKLIKDLLQTSLEANNGASSELETLLEQNEDKLMQWCVQNGTGPQIELLLAIISRTDLTEDSKLKRLVSINSDP